MTNFYKLLLLLAMTFASYTSFADSRNTITGQIVHTKTKEKIPYLNISLKGTTIGTTSNEKGQFTLPSLPHGNQTLVVSGVGYRRVELQIDASKLSVPIVIETEDENISMDEVVVSANRNERNKKEASTIVSILSPRVFETTNSTNLAQGLNFQSGLRVENSCQNCGFPQVRINGLDGQYSQILIDSRPIFSSLSGVYGLEQLPSSMVERVEVIRGGGSTLYGSNAVGGVINIITKEPTRNSFGIGNSTTLIGMKNADINTFVNASLLTDDYKSGLYIFGSVKDRAHYDRNDDGFSELGDIKASTVGFRGYHKISNYSRLSAEYHNLNEYRRGGNNFDRPPHETDITEQTQYYTNGGGIKYDLWSKDFAKKLSAYTSMQHNQRSSYYGAGKDPNAYGSTKDITYVAGSQYSMQIDKLLFMPSELIVGAEYSANILNDKAPGYNRYIDQETQVVSGFIQNEWSTKQFGLLAGVRIDKHNLVQEAIISPRLSVRYNPSEAVNLRATYSSGFRAPQAYDEDLHILAVSGEVALINVDPNLKAEKSHSFSGSIDLYPTLGNIKSNFLIEGFYTKLNDKFELVETGFDSNGNILRTRINGPGAYVAGANLELKTIFSHRLDAQIGYTQQVSRYESPLEWTDDGSLTPQKRMFRTPDNYGFMAVNAEITEKILATISGTYTGPMLIQHVLTAEDKNTGTVSSTFMEKNTNSFCDLNFRVAYDLQLSKSIMLQIHAGIQNIFDSYQSDLDRGAFRDSKYIYGPTLPRSISFGAKFSLL